METLHLSERERKVIYEGGIIVGREEGLEEGLAKGLAKGREEGREMGREEGREMGREEGRMEGQIEERTAIARNLLSMGMSIADIVKATGLPEEEIGFLAL